MKNELLPTKIEVDQHLAMNPPPIMQINIQKKHSQWDEKSENFP